MAHIEWRRARRAREELNLLQLELTSRQTGCREIEAQRAQWQGLRHQHAAASDVHCDVASFSIFAAMCALFACMHSCVCVPGVGCMYKYSTNRVSRTRGDRPLSSLTTSHRPTHDVLARLHPCIPFFSIMWHPDPSLSRVGIYRIIVQRRTPARTRAASRAPVATPHSPPPRARARGGGE